MESPSTDLSGIWPAADGHHYPHTPALFAQIALVAVI